MTRLDYDSKDYAGNGAAITKTAYIYTPYGYDENDEKTRVTIQHPHCSEHFVFFTVGGQSGFTACPPPGTAQIRQISKLI